MHYVFLQQDHTTGKPMNTLTYQIGKCFCGPWEVRYDRIFVHCVFYNISLPLCARPWKSMTGCGGGFINRKMLHFKYFMLFFNSALYPRLHLVNIIWGTTFYDDTARCPSSFLFLVSSLCWSFPLHVSDVTLILPCTCHLAADDIIIGYYIALVHKGSECRKVRYNQAGVWTGLR